MICAQCKTEFIPPNREAHRKYCSKACKHIVRNASRRILRDEIRIAKLTDRPMYHAPSREHIQRIDIPAIPEEFSFLQRRLKRPVRISPRYAASQEEKRKAAVRTMVEKCAS